jgi:putative ATPase
VDQVFLPDSCPAHKFYEPQENSKENEIRNRMSRMWKKYGY